MPSLKSPPLKPVNKFKKSTGFTLIEILTVIFLGAVIIMAGYLVFMASQKSYKVNTESSELTQNGRIALARMSREIRQAQDIVVPETFPASPDESTQNIIEFQDGHTITSPDPNCNIQYIEYTVSNRELTRKLIRYRDPAKNNNCVAKNLRVTTETAPTEVKAENISLLKFWKASETITIYLEVSKDNKTYQFETQVVPRNI